MSKVKAKSYCITFGCFNKDNDPNLTFFTLPRDIKRRQEWLKLIDREDLLEKEELKKSSYLVCSAHFEQSSFKLIKHLKYGAIPTLNLFGQPREDTSRTDEQLTKDNVNKSSSNKKYVTVGTQTEPVDLKKKKTPSLKTPTKGISRKRKRAN